MSKFWRWLDGRWLRVLAYGSRVVDKCASLSIIFATCTMFLAAGVLYALTATQVATSVGGRVHPFWRSISNFVLKLMGTAPDRLEGSKYSEALSVVIGAVGVVVTVYFALTAFISILKSRRDLEKRSLIRSRRVFTDGVEDVDEMLRFYERAEWVVVFAGDFSWLNPASALLSSVQRLASAGKITLVSYKSEETVRQSIESTVYAELAHCFRFEPDRKLKCSLVRVGHRNVLLYLVDAVADDIDYKQVCTVDGRDNARYLMETMENLCRPFIPGWSNAGNTAARAVAL